MIGLKLFDRVSLDIAIVLRGQYSNGPTMLVASVVTTISSGEPVQP